MRSFFEVRKPLSILPLTGTPDQAYGDALELFEHPHVRRPTGFPEGKQDAERRAADIFAQADFEVVWLRCLHACAEEAAACRNIDLPQHISLRIVRNPLTSTNDAVFGVAFLASDGTGKYSDVFRKRVEKLHAAAGLDPGSVLGSVMAHELGHLLLGSNAHAISGIMRAHWEAGELRQIAMGSFLFTPQQVERMHGKGYGEEPGQQEVAGLRRRGL